MLLREAKDILEKNGYYLLEDNSILRRAARNKDDEFYTYLSDVEKEMKNYDFSGKTVYCCCDDPEWSNVYKYFEDNFESLGLDGLISSHYEKSGKTYWTEYIDGERIEHPMKGNGDCMSSECRRLADMADVIVTNPPFSIFSKIVQTYINKPFIMLCIPMKMASKTLLPLFLDNSIHYGYTRIGKFYRPNGENDKRVQTIWYTNMKVRKSFKQPSIVEYDENKFIKYDNFDAINTNNQYEIPNVDGLIGVPVTILQNVDQANMPFEIVGKKDDLRINGKKVFSRLIIRMK